MPTAVPRREDLASSNSEMNIWVAAGEGDIERVKYLIENEGMSPSSPDSNTYTPIHAAASYGKHEMLRFLLNHPKAQSNAVETLDSDGDSALFVVEDLETAKLLVEEFKADVARKNNEGQTPADAADENEHEEIAAYFRSLLGQPLISQPIVSSDLINQTANLNLNPETRGEGGIDPSTREISNQMSEAIDDRVEVLMERVNEIMSRASERTKNERRAALASANPDGDANADGNGNGNGNGDLDDEDLGEGEIQLTKEEEDEMRAVVGEDVMKSILEGWNGGGSGSEWESSQEEAQEDDGNWDFQDED